MPRFRLALFILSVVMLPLSSVQALPFLNQDQAPIIHFSDQQNGEWLGPVLKTSLETFRQDQKLANRRLTLRKQAQQEKVLLSKALRAEGFYAAKIDVEIKPDQIQYQVTPGPQYQLQSIEIQSNLTSPPSTAPLKIQPGDPFRAEDILTSRDQLRQQVEKSNCLWQVQIDYDARVTHQTQTGQLTFLIGDSRDASIASIDIQGQTSLDPDYLKTKLGLKTGDCFRRSQIEKARLNLYQTGLISSVDSQLDLNDQQVDVIFRIQERQHRTFKAGAGYSSDEGPYLSAGWTHRNFWGRAEKLDLNARMSELYRTADAYLTMPDFRQPKQTLILGGELAEEHLEAFDSQSIELQATLKRLLRPKLTGALGTRYQLTLIEDMGEEDTYGLWSFPVSLSYDLRNDHLNPTQGWFASVGLEPFVDTLNSGTSFIKARFGGSGYHTFKTWPGRPTLALRGSIGSMTGQSIDDIPAAERFYAGGGGSVRGYAYQLLGPLDDEDEPIGGRSFTELSLESRWHMTQDWGGVLFVDGGNAYESITPDWNEGLRWAAGLGVRYFTDFAPIRLDLAFPLDRRDGVDDSFQFYISIGQAF